MPQKKQKMSEWANSSEKRIADRGQVIEQPQGETVDLSLRRYLGANPMPVKLSEKKLLKEFEQYKKKDSIIEDNVRSISFNREKIAEEKAINMVKSKFGSNQVNVIPYKDEEAIGRTDVKNHRYWLAEYKSRQNGENQYCRVDLKENRCDTPPSERIKDAIRLQFEDNESFVQEDDTEMKRNKSVPKLPQRPKWNFGDDTDETPPVKKRNKSVPKLPQRPKWNFGEDQLQESEMNEEVSQMVQDKCGTPIKMRQMQSDPKYWMVKYTKKEGDEWSCLVNMDEGKCNPAVSPNSDKIMSMYIDDDIDKTVLMKRGRPPGVKNKPKTESAISEKSTFGHSNDLKNVSQIVKKKLQKPVSRATRLRGFNHTWLVETPDSESGKFFLVCTETGGCENFAKMPRYQKILGGSRGQSPEETAAKYFVTHQAKEVTEDHFGQENNEMENAIYEAIMELSGEVEVNHIKKMGMEDDTHEFLVSYNDENDNTLIATVDVWEENGQWVSTGMNENNQVAARAKFNKMMNQDYKSGNHWKLR